ncbi:hypothetical protein [Sandaracinus amylolyticus]|uniref:hypothetical protein n=1 Tax=Sandaracinus amylolyticus TaxID=927083 RepID=UPI001F3A65A5|nr:hypothetical protein [Sandaracinus amylolyticus]UJR79862.1 Hypothetical protein I5071_19010 [Sandaracinus amylolyticus]
MSATDVTDTGRCSWCSADTHPDDELVCTAPAVCGGFCEEHAHDAEREIAAERLAEAESDVIRSIYLIRAIGCDLERWRTCIARMRSAAKRTIALSLITGEQLDPDHRRLRDRITALNPIEPASAADYRHLDALRAYCARRVPSARSAA